VPGRIRAGGIRAGDIRGNPRSRRSEETGTLSKSTGLWHAFDVVTKQALSKAVHKEPFQPFVLHLADGRAFTVPHRDLVSVHPTGRTVIVYGEDEDLGILDVMLITSLELMKKGTK
jgi:hypothetical protein